MFIFAFSAHPTRSAQIVASVTTVRANVVLVRLALPRDTAANTANVMTTLAHIATIGCVEVSLMSQYKPRL